MKSRPSSRIGFTLIELLIVVAIIAILAAIAVPNFLEAQTRSKVARLQADMRTAVVALESYRVDTNKYPNSIDRDTNVTFAPRIGAYKSLTTPIAYLSSAVRDVFNTNEPKSLSGGSEADQRVVVYWGPDFNYIYVNRAGQSFDNSDRTVTIFQEFPNIVTGPPANRKLRDGENLFTLLSYSPDQDFDVTNPTSPEDGTFPAPIQQYDPTNGTVSDGDIVRSRGD